MFNNIVSRIRDILKYVLGIIIFSGLILYDLGIGIGDINRGYGHSIDFGILGHSELTIANIRYWLDFYNIRNKEIALRQIILETGNLRSNVCIRDNNLFGLYNGRRYLFFGHWSESIRCYKKIEDKNIYNKDYYKFLEEYRYSADRGYIKKLKRIDIVEE